MVHLDRGGPNILLATAKKKHLKHQWKHVHNSTSEKYHFYLAKTLMEAQLCHTSTALPLSAFQQLFLVKDAMSALNSSDAFHYQHMF